MEKYMILGAIVAKRGKCFTDLPSGSMGFGVVEWLFDGNGL